MPQVCGVITTGAFASSAVVPAAALWKVPGEPGQEELGVEQGGGEGRK